VRRDDLSARELLRDAGVGVAYAVLRFGDRPGPQGAHFSSLAGV